MEDIPWALVAPLALIQLTLAVIAIVDLVRRPVVAGMPKWGWAIVIVVFGLIGPVLYLTIGRKDS